LTFEKKPCAASRLKLLVCKALVAQKKGIDYAENLSRAAKSLRGAA
jgi:hypothetical protein